MIQFTNTVPVGTAIFIVQDGKLLLMKRKGSFGEGTWGLVGGKLEMGEKSMLGLVREVTEELGIWIPWMIPVGWNDYFDKHKGQDTQWITLFYYTEQFYGKPEIKDDKHTDMGWFDIDRLPKPLFAPLELYIKNNGVPNGLTKPKIQTLAPCPYMMGFQKDYPCGGHLARGRILDAEKLSSCCLKCGRWFGLELIEQHEAALFNPSLAKNKFSPPDKKIGHAMKWLKRFADQYENKKLDETVALLEETIAGLKQNGES